MNNSFTKRVWVIFSETFGTSIIHPQSTVLRFQKEAIEEARKYAKGKLVDIGCGRMPYRKDLEPLVSEYIGVDHPEVSKLYKGVKPEVLADAKKLPFKEKSFDIALLLQVLEHVDDPAKVIKEAARVLKPKGVLIISIPFFYPLHDMPYDFGRYTPTSFKSFIEDSSLKLIKIKTQGTFWQFWFQMLNTFLIKRINDMILNLNVYTAILLIPMIILSVPVVILSNCLVFLINLVSGLMPKYPDYFPLDYLVVARKK